MKTHELKSWHEFFSLSWTGFKSFEVRRNDRKFETGDTVTLKEWNPQKGLYSGRFIRAEIIFVFRDLIGVDHGFVVLALQEISRSEPKPLLFPGPEVKE